MHTKNPSECDLDLVSAAVDDELAEEEKVWLNGHLEICPSCRKEYQEMRRTSNLVTSFRHVPPPKTLLRDIRGTLVREDLTKGSRDPGKRLTLGGLFASPPRMAFAAGVCATLLILGIVRLQTPPVLAPITGFGIAAEAKEEIAALDLVLVYDMRTLSPDPVKLGEVNRGFLMESKVGDGMIRVSMAAAQGVPMSGLAPILEIPVRTQSEGETPTLSIREARAYRVDGSEVEVDLRTIPMPLSGIGGKDTAA
ncbi:MAG: zf-HC2 domain-containing protein [Candidatus Omnitrophica bacterium]|nr:zf-HC2 domain-containing protein [Candidatus Omnitrophota bacterium]